MYIFSFNQCLLQQNLPFDKPVKEFSILFLFAKILFKWKISKIFKTKFWLNICPFITTNLMADLSQILNWGSQYNLVFLVWFKTSLRSWLTSNWERFSFKTKLVSKHFFTTKYILANKPDKAIVIKVEPQGVYTRYKEVETQIELCSIYQVRSSNIPKIIHIKIKIKNQ